MPILKNLIIAAVLLVSFQSPFWSTDSVPDSGLDAAANPPPPPKPSPDAAPDNDPAVTVAQQYAGFQKAALASSKVETAPQKRSRSLVLADKLNLPAEYVDAHYDQLSREVPLTSLDYHHLLDHHPELSKWFSDPHNSSIAHDEVPQLQSLDTAVHQLVGGDVTGILPPGYMFKKDGSIIEKVPNGKESVLPGLIALRSELNRRFGWVDDVNAGPTEGDPLEKCESYWRIEFKKYSKKIEADKQSAAVAERERFQTFTNVLGSLLGIGLVVLLARILLHMHAKKQYGWLRITIIASPLGGIIGAIMGWNNSDYGARGATAVGIGFLGFILLPLSVAIGRQIYLWIRSGFSDEKQMATLNSTADDGALAKSAAGLQPKQEQ